MFSARTQAVSLSVLTSLVGADLPLSELSSPSNPLPAVHHVESDRQSAKSLVEARGATWSTFSVAHPAVRLIDIRNYHLKKAQSSTAQSAEKYWEVQKEVFEIVAACKSEYEIAGVYPEGATKNYNQVYLRNFDEQRSKLGPDNIKAENSLRGLLSGAPESLRSHGGLAGAVIKFNIPFKTSEDFNLLTQAEEAERLRAADAEKLIFTARENHLLNKIQSDFPNAHQLSNNESVTVITNFGAEHRFLDNVMEWNKTHPDYQIELVEITPLTVLKIRDEVEQIKTKPEITKLDK